MARFYSATQRHNAAAPLADFCTAAHTAFSMGTWDRVGDYLKEATLGMDALSAQATSVGTHAVVGGALSVAQGGSFMEGFASAGIGSVAGFGAAGIGDDAGGIYTRTAIAATAGGLASEITGGKFSNGAITAAFAHLYNYEQHFGRQTVLGAGAGGGYEYGAAGAQFIVDAVAAVFGVASADNTFPYRVLFQAQGGGLEASVGIISVNPITLTDGNVGLSQLFDGLTYSQRGERGASFRDASDYLSRCAEGGGCAPSDRSFYAKRGSDIRVDVVIQAGRNFVAGGRSGAIINPTVKGQPR